MLGKIQGRRRGWQRTRWLERISDSMDMSWSKLWEMVKDCEAWHAAVHRGPNSYMTEWLNSKQQSFFSTKLHCHMYARFFLLSDLKFFPLPITFIEPHCVHACAVTQSCPTLCNPMDCRPQGSSIHGIFLARTLEWVAISSSRGSSWLRDRTRVSCVSCIAGRLFTTEPPKIMYNLETGMKT